MTESIKKGLGVALSHKELRAIMYKEQREGDYYDYELLRSVLLRAKQGEFSAEYFKDWLIFVGGVLMPYDAYYPLGDTLDAFSFSEKFDERVISELIARLKAFDYKLRHKDYMADHDKEKLRVVYLRNEHCNRTENSIVYKAYFVDYKTRRFDVRLIDDAFYVFHDDVLYCSIDAPPVETESEIICDPPYATKEEEILLYDHFFNEEEKWTYDHSLDF